MNITWKSLLANQILVMRLSRISELMIKPLLPVSKSDARLLDRKPRVAQHLSDKAANRLFFSATFFQLSDNIDRTKL
jgi:hypothetical protein